MDKLGWCDGWIKLEGWAVHEAFSGVSDEPDRAGVVEKECDSLVVWSPMCFPDEFAAWCVPSGFDIFFVLIEFFNKHHRSVGVVGGVRADLRTCFATSTQQDCEQAETRCFHAFAILVFTLSRTFMKLM